MCKYFQSFLLIFVFININFAPSIIYAQKNPTDRHLFMAVTKKEIKAINEALKNGANINATSDQGLTVLMHAIIFTNDLNIVKHLINKGADYKAKNKEGLTVFMCTVQKGNIDIFKLLMELGLDIDTDTATKALIGAASMGNTEIINLLIEKGAMINANNSVGCTALMMACSKGRLDAAELLIKKGADVKIRDKTGETALHNLIGGAAMMEYAYKRTPYVANLLIQKGADLNAKTIAGISPLSISVFNGDYDITKVLIKNGADPNIKDMYGNTPLMDAIMFENIDIIRLLLSEGADPNIKDKNGKTVLMNALEYCSSSEIIDLLKNKQLKFSQAAENKFNKYLTAMESNELAEKEVKKILPNAALVSVSPGNSKLDRYSDGSVDLRITSWCLKYETNKKQINIHVLENKQVKSFGIIDIESESEFHPIKNWYIDSDEAINKAQKFGKSYSSFYELMLRNNIIEEKTVLLWSTPWRLPEYQPIFINATNGKILTFEDEGGWREVNE